MEEEGLVEVGSGRCSESANVVVTMVVASDER